MRIIEDGHIYALEPVVKDSLAWQRLQFIKRSSGCVTHDKEYPGINTQEVIRVAIHRSKFLYSVLPCDETAEATYHLRMALYQYEARAYRRKHQERNKTERGHDSTLPVPFPVQNIEHRAICGVCGHIMCSEHERGHE